MVADALHQLCDVGNRFGPLVHVPLNGDAPKADLKRTMLKWIVQKVALGVPLEANGIGLQLPLPMVVVAVGYWVVVAKRGIGERLLEASPANLNSKNAFLVLLSCPPAAICHPQERGLNPGHSVQLERRDQFVCFESVLCDCVGVCLVDRNGLLVVVGANLSEWQF